MDASTLQSGIFLLIMVASIAAMFMGDDKQKQQSAGMVSAEEDMVDPGDLGSATGHPVCDQKPSVVARVTESVAKVDIKKSANDMIESIKGIPLSVVPDSTIGNMTKAIREYTANKTNGVKMSWNQAMALAADIKQLYANRKAVPPDPEPEVEKKGKTDVNAA